MLHVSILYVKIIANDNLYTSYIMSCARLNTPNLRFEKLGKDPFDIFNNEKNKLKGFIYNNFSPGGSERQYFSNIFWKIIIWYSSSKFIFSYRY